MSDIYTEEEQEAFWAKQREKRVAHDATLDDSTLFLAAAVRRRVEDALYYDRKILSVPVPMDEYLAYEKWLLPTERYEDTALAKAGTQNLLCKRVAVYGYE